jgi:hypothetical protein
MAATCARFIVIQRQNTPRRHIPTPRKPRPSINCSTKVDSFSGSQIRGAVNWDDLLCLDVEVSLLDGIVTVTVEGAAPEAVELCRFVSEELARRGHGSIRVRTEW